MCDPSTKRLDHVLAATCLASFAKRDDGRIDSTATQGYVSCAIPCAFRTPSHAQSSCMRPVTAETYVKRKQGVDEESDV